jgi:DNA-binding transcriptional regulator YiaG
MPADDRDPKFERALAHHLRGNSAAACPDAEALAAYHERSLSLEEMAHWKQHISGCAACQETLALVETTEKQLVEDWENKEIALLAAVQPPAPMRSLAAVREEAAGEDTPAAASAPVEISLRRRPLLLRWAIPLGAVAAGILVWIGIHEQHALTRHAERVQTAQNQSSSMPVQTAQNQPAPAPEQKLTETLRDVQPPMERDDRLAQNEIASAHKRLEEMEESGRRNPSVPASAPKPSAKDAEQAKKESRSQASDALAYKTAPAPPPPLVLRQAQPKAPASANENVEVSAATTSADTAPGLAVSGGAAGGAAAEAKTKSAAPAHREKALTGQQSAANDLDTSAMMMKQGVNGRNMPSSSALALLPAVILTPDHRVWWRLGPGGALELTIDGGKTWKPVDAGAGGQLTAGSAPSSRICWIAGKAGTLVLTTDGGAHWKALTTPITGDLGGVRATDAKHASIWDAAHQKSFETSDGGATWTQTAP